jgi:hypothetical protein
MSKNDHPMPTRFEINQPGHLGRPRADEAAPTEIVQRHPVGVRRRPRAEHGQRERSQDRHEARMRGYTEAMRIIQVLFVFVCVVVIAVGAMVAWAALSNRIQWTVPVPAVSIPAPR